MKTHRDLEVYQMSLDYVTRIYTVTKKYPKEEIFGLTSQLRRAAVSIPSNISEGAARKSNKEFIQFLYYSLGSALEVETQLQISLNLQYIIQKEYEELIVTITQIIKMIQGLINFLKKKEGK